MEPDAAFWNNLLSAISMRRVVPVVGSGAVVVMDQKTGDHVLFSEWLAPKLASAMKMMGSLGRGTLNEIAMRRLTQAGAKRDELYPHIRILIENASLSPAQALLDLAGITDFQIYISTSFDPFLRDALASVRPLFDPVRHTIAFHPREVLDLPPEANQRGGQAPPFLHQIMGNLQSWPDFAVWDEDHMEFICELQNRAGELRRLFELLKENSLLLIGNCFSDWVVRFFLRVAKQGRLSERSSMTRDYVTNEPAQMTESMIQYFDHIVGSTTLIRMPPAEFIAKLRREWDNRVLALRAKAAHDTAPRTNTASSAQRETRDGSFFLSYAREDREAACRLYHALMNAGIVVYFDQNRLQIGGHYEGGLQHAVERQCGYFLSLISSTTVNTTEAYYHKERRWAASRAENIPDGGVFYLPVVIEDQIEPKLEPAIFSKIHYDRLPGGYVTPDFISRLKRLQDHYQRTGQPPIEK